MGLFSYYGVSAMLGGATLVPTASTLTYNSAPAPIYSALARQYVDTNANSLTATIYSTAFYNFGPPGKLPITEASVAVYVNGQFLRALTATKQAAAEDITFAIPGTGTRRVCFVFGTQSRAMDAGDVEGTIVQRILTPVGNFTLTPVVLPKQTQVIASIGDSISVEIGSDIPGRDGALSILLQRYGDTVGYYALGYGSKRGGVAFADANIGALITQLDGILGGVQLPRIHIQLGANDFFSGAYTPQQLATAMGNFCDAARQRFPNVLIVISNMLLTDQGDNSAYNSAVEGVRAGRLAFVTIEDLRSQITVNDLVDGVHPGNAAQLTIANIREKTALYGSAWKDVFIPPQFRDADLVMTGVHYSTSSTDGLQGHRGLGNVYNPAGGYISLQMQYNGMNDQNGSIGLHTLNKRVSRDQMALSLYVNTAGKLVFGWNNPSTGLYEVLNSSATAIPGYYYVLNRNNTGNGFIGVLGGPNKLQPGQYTSIYASPAAYTGADLYPVIDILGVAGAGLSTVQADASSLVPFSTEYSATSSPASGYALDLAPATTKQSFQVPGLASAPCATLILKLNKTAGTEQFYFVASIDDPDGSTKQALAYLGSALGTGQARGLGLQTYTNSLRRSPNPNVLDGGVSIVVTAKFYPGNPSAFSMRINGVAQSMEDQNLPHGVRAFTNTFTYGGDDANTTFDWPGLRKRGFLYLTDLSPSDVAQTENFLSSQ